MKGKRSKEALRGFLLEEEPEAGGEVADPRAEAMRALATDDTGALEAIRLIFAGTGLPDDPVKVSRLLRVRAEIRKEWSDARDSFLAIGRALLSLDETLSRAELTRLRQASERLFPFSDATATQLRQIARAVDSGRLPQQLCPGSYGTAYQLTLLSDAQMQVAWERGLLRPDVTRREIMSLRREIRTIDGAFAEQPPGRIDRAALREERRRLAERRERLLEDLAAIERRLTSIDGLLANGANAVATEAG